MFRKNVTETKRIFTSECFRTENLSASGHELLSAYFQLPVMNLEEIWVRNLFTTYGRASLPAKPEFPMKHDRSVLRLVVVRHAKAVVARWPAMKRAMLPWWLFQCPPAVCIPESALPYTPSARSRMLAPRTAAHAGLGRPQCCVRAPENSAELRRNGGTRESGSR